MAWRRIGCAFQCAPQPLTHGGDPGAAPFAEESTEITFPLGDPSAAISQGLYSSPPPTNPSSLPPCHGWPLGGSLGAIFRQEAVRPQESTKWWAETRASLCPPSVVPVSSCLAPGPAAVVARGLSSTPRSPTSPAQPWPLEPAIHPMYSQENGCFPQTLGREVASDPRSHSSFFSPRSRDSPADGG